MDNTDYLIIGGSAAGMAAAQAIKEQRPESNVTVLTDEPDMPYFRPLIPYIITGGKDADAISLIGKGPYTRSDINILREARVSSVDITQKIAFVKDKDPIHFDKVLFATGSRPRMPKDIECIDAEDVYALRTLSDARKVFKRVDVADQAVMLGGGLVNLKTAFALLERGIKVTLVVNSPEVLSQIMEAEDAFLIRKSLLGAGLNIVTGCNARAVVVKQSSVCAVALDNGSDIPCQMVFIGKGVVANTEYLEGSGIRIDRGIVVDKYTGGSSPDTYAAGDVAVTFDPLTNEKMMTALWTNAVEMGRCAGLNMAGIKTAYTGTFGVMNATQIAGMPFVSMGVIHTTGIDCEVYKYRSDSVYRKVVFSKDGSRLIGAVFIGNISRAGLYRYIMRERRDVLAIKKHIINNTLHYGLLM